MRRAAILAIAAGTSLIGISAASAQPGGAYRQSCRDIEQRGSNLTASCRAPGGRWVQSYIDLRTCGGSIGNANGRLVCDSGGRRSRGDDDGYGRRDRDRDRDYGRDSSRRGGWDEEPRRRY